MTTTALTVEENRALQAQIAALGGLAVAGDENLQQGDIGMPPRLRISQPNRPIKIGDEPVAPGSFVNTVTNEVFAEGIEIVPLVFLPDTRVMWPPKFDTENDPMCASDDGKRPSGNTAQRELSSPQCGPCAQCSDAQFIDGEAPRCKRQRNILVWLVDSTEPAILTMQSTALSSARNISTLAKMQGVSKTIMLITQERDNNQGKWFIPDATKGRKLEGRNLLVVLEARNELQNLVVTADVEIVAEVEDDPHGGGAGKNPIDGGSIPWDEVEPDLGGAEPAQQVAPTRPPMPEAPPF